MKLQRHLMDEHYKEIQEEIVNIEKCRDVMEKQMEDIVVNNKTEVNYNSVSNYTRNAKDVKITLILQKG